LDAHHGEELFFLSDSFPSDWEHTDKDQEFGKVMRRYWVAFANTGDPDIDHIGSFSPEPFGWLAPASLLGAREPTLSWNNYYK
jgi:Carboxylesterase family